VPPGADSFKFRIDSGKHDTLISAGNWGSTSPTTLIVSSPHYNSHDRSGGFRPSRELSSLCCALPRGSTLGDVALHRRYVCFVALSRGAPLPALKGCYLLGWDVAPPAFYYSLPLLSAGLHFISLANRISIQAGDFEPLFPLISFS
jgi:hypothetical protein